MENDELYISMVDDTTERKVTIPAAFLLGRNGYVFPYLDQKFNFPLLVTDFSISVIKLYSRYLDTILRSFLSA